MGNTNPEESKGLVANVTELFGLIAGVGVLLYVLGGAVMGLRLWYAGLPVWAVVSQLPREMLVTEALVDVVLPYTLVTGVYLAWCVVGFRFATTGPDAPHRAALDAPDPERHLLWNYFIVAVGLFLLTALFKGVLADVGWFIVVVRISSLMVAVGVLTLTLGLLSLAGRAHLQGRRDLAPLEEPSTKGPPKGSHKSDQPTDFRRLTAVGLLFAMPLIPVFVGVASVFPLLNAKVCATERRWEKLGLLVSHSTDTVYLGRDTAEKGHRPILVIPVDRIEELVIGSDADTLQRLPCDPQGAVPHPTPAVTSQNRTPHGRYGRLPNVSTSAW